MLAPKDLNETLSRRGVTIKRESKLKKILAGSGIDKKLDKLLYTHHHSDAAQELIKTYVTNSVDAQLAELSDTETNKVAVLVGARGAGKSASIRYHFKLLAMPSIAGSKLLIPLYLDNLTEKGFENCKRLIASSFSNAARLLLETSGKSANAPELLAFVRETKATLVERGHLPDVEPGLLSDHSIVEELRKNHFLGYSISLLKFALHTCASISGIKTVSVIGDDIESLHEDGVLLDVVATILSSMTCMENMGNFQRPCALLTVLALRPATYDLIKSSPVLNGYDIPRTPLYLSPVDILKMFEKRVETFVQDEFDEVNKTKWFEALTILANICNSLGNAHAQFFIGLANYNLRDACGLVRTVIDNSQWYENIWTDDNTSAGVINISAKDYHITQAALVRAIGLEDRTAYISNNSTPIVNLFHCFGNYEALLLGPYLIKFCQRKKNERGYSRFTFAEIEMEMGRIFPDQIVAQLLPKLVNYYLESGLLRLVTLAEKHYVTQPRMFSLWQHLVYSSVLIECFRDNTAILHQSISEFPHFEKAAAELANGKFFCAIDFISSCLEREKELRSKLNQANHFAVKAAFGEKLVSSRLEAGLTTSLQAYYQKSSYPSRLSERLADLRSEISELTSKRI
jgi:hypothetical protein